jgi:hypothetical protein
MIDRARFITHHDKQILLIDLSNCSPDNVDTIFRTVPDLVTTRPLGSVLVLSDFTGASFDEEAILVMQETAVFRQAVHQEVRICGNGQLSSGILRESEKLLPPRISRF